MVLLDVILQSFLDFHPVPLPDFGSLAVSVTKDGLLQCTVATRMEDFSVYITGDTYHPQLYRFRHNPLPITSCT